jgi:hypothetical protein
VLIPPQNSGGAVQIGHNRQFLLEFFQCLHVPPVLWIYGG